MLTALKFFLIFKSLSVSHIACWLVLAYVLNSIHVFTLRLRERLLCTESTNHFVEIFKKSSFIYVMIVKVVQKMQQNIHSTVTAGLKLKSVSENFDILSVISKSMHAIFFISWWYFIFNPFTVTGMVLQIFFFPQTICKLFCVMMRKRCMIFGTSVRLSSVPRYYWCVFAICVWKLS